MSDEYTIVRISKKDLNLIKPLWEKLNQMHYEDSKYFKDYYIQFTFEKRIEKFNKLPEEHLYVEIIKNDINEASGYCISTIDKDNAGEIDSIYIGEEFRNKKIGEELIRNSIRWLKKNNCTNIITTVSYGHEIVFKFYEKMGLYPRKTILELIGDK